MRRSKTFNRREGYLFVEISAGAVTPRAPGPSRAIRTGRLAG